MTQLLNVRLALLSDTTANWEAAATGVLLKGEIGIEFTPDGKTKMKIGDGTTPWTQLPYFGGDDTEGSLLLGDGKSIVVEDEQIKLFGFGTASAGQVPQMGSDGTLVWYTPVTPETVSALSIKFDTLNTTVQSQATAILALETAAVALEKRVVALEEKASKAYKYIGSVPTYAELPTEGMSIGDVYNIEQADEAHGISAGDNMAWNGTNWDNLHGIIDLSNLATKTELQEAQTQITTSKTLIDVINKTSTKVKYEVLHKPAGTIVDYREKEIRILCPADTNYSQQTSGENADPNLYYVGFYAYAPDNASSFKEGLGSTQEVEDEMLYFEGGFAGVDAYGRKYSVVWLPVAVFDGNTWTYYGAASNTFKYAGWYYAVEWYDEAGLKIGSDCIRINLSNEACHNYVGSYVGVPVLHGVSVGGTLLDIVDGLVNVPLGAGLKSTTEIVITEDGGIEVGQISFDKIIQDENSVLVLNGGGANIVLG